MRKGGGGPDIRFRRTYKVWGGGGLVMGGLGVLVVGSGVVGVGSVVGCLGRSENLR